MERRKAQVGSRRLFAPTCNGSYLPPTLRLRPGDRLDLAMTNRTGEGTNLYVHGLHASPRSPADNIFITIKPGQTYRYSYRLPPPRHPARTGTTRTRTSDPPRRWPEASRASSSTG
ncbi:multicopper oxidase domain-containing protein [Streptantibioticus rubrisoli]|uniref:Multicopper oxidase domain-containing protein n=1 Tax=Streptantibioticus rubrisoli TaxID=1387313 RepID=A0ABT1PEM0_9ACTN|nr:multicopper oxidase domain-containing protein [Streptantibioticus rubrisoli]MCQ4043825.1 multicopper oxidase domain-containing protein [Streptantibioticus rubrisoli]